MIFRKEMLNIKLGIILCLAFILRIFLLDIHLSDPKYSIQQDDYLDYTIALKNNTINTQQFPDFNKRLFPGYPIAIYIFSGLIPPLAAGVLMNLLFSILAIYLLWLLTRNLTATAFFAFFPPIWITQGTKIATEPIMAVFLLLAIFLYLKRSSLLSGIILGLSFNIRLISICLFLALVILSLSKRNYQKAKSLFLGFIPSSFILLIYNYFVFGKTGIFKQFVNLNDNYNGIKIGILQIISDLFRTLDWHQYRIFASGVFYLLYVLVGLYLLYKKRKSEKFIKICFLWLLFSLIFIFALGPTPLLEDFARYATPVLPAVAVGFTYKGYKKDEK